MFALMKNGFFSLAAAEHLAKLLGELGRLLAERLLTDRVLRELIGGCHVNGFGDHGSEVPGVP